jgi:hypothetical protein
LHEGNSAASRATDQLVKKYILATGKKQELFRNPNLAYWGQEEKAATGATRRVPN